MAMSKVWDKENMKKHLLIIMLSWFFLANSWAGLPGGGKPKLEKIIAYGPFKDKATCEDIRRQVKPVTECWEA